MADYIYERESVNGSWNINNSIRVDGESKQINIAKEVEVAIPGKLFKVCCNASEAKFIFDEELTSAEQTILDTIVNTHKNNL